MIETAYYTNKCMFLDSRHLQLVLLPLPLPRRGHEVCAFIPEHVPHLCPLGLQVPRPRGTGRRMYMTNV